MIHKADVFRSAHAEARRMIKWSRFTGPYRAAFKIALRNVWSAEKEAVENAAYEAGLPPIPADVAAKAKALSEAAWGCRIDGPGNEMFSRLTAEASALRNEARGL